MFFQAINHGMSPEFLEEVRQVAKLFFALPMEDKLKYSREEDKMEGYGNDMIFSNQQILDWTDRLYLTVCPEESRRFKYWPTNPERFRYFPNLLNSLNNFYMCFGLWVVNKSLQKLLVLKHVSDRTSE